MQSLKKTQAPSFKLRDSTDQWVDLNSFKGKWLVIFFYPKDDTPGCTKEACNFRDNYSLIKSIGGQCCWYQPRWLVFTPKI